MNTNVSSTRKKYRRSLVYDDFGPPLSSIRLLNTDLPPLGDGCVRVAMEMAPINPSDTIPITGAYAQRITLPAVAGYEGVGQVVDASSDFIHLLGQRVLPLRGEGTWQNLVDCAGRDAVAIPESVPNLIAARAYINPLAALTMLRFWPVQDKTIVLTGAGSNFAEIMGQMALKQGAKSVIGIYRSANRAGRLQSLGIEAVSQQNQTRILEITRVSDIVFDALGGDVAENILRVMTRGSVFVSYGLLTGRPIKLNDRVNASFNRFHLRDHLNSVAPNGLAEIYPELWHEIMGIEWPDVSVFPVNSWKTAILEVDKPGALKPLLDFQNMGGCH